MSLLDKQEVQYIGENTALSARKWSGFIYVNERQEIQHYRAMKNKKKEEECQIVLFLLRAVRT